VSVLLTEFLSALDMFLIFVETDFILISLVAFTRKHPYDAPETRD